MTDREPSHSGRYKGLITPEERAKMEAGQPFTITLNRADDPVKLGTPYNKASVLPDALAVRLCPKIPDPTPADALEALLTMAAEANTKATNAQTTAMPKAGGAFTGNVVAYGTNRTTAGLRNIEVRTSSATGTLQSTNKIIMVRK